MIRSLSENYLWLLTAAILAATLVVSSGFFSLDEVIYYLGARAIAQDGALGIDNGYSQFHSENLKLWFLVDGPQGLTPQYPAGSSILAAMLLPFVGARAFIILNAAAGVLTLFAVRRICIAHFKSELVARLAIGLLVLGTFWGEYAFGIWPHALAVYFSTQAYWMALRHLESGGRDYRAAVASGLLAGAGLMCRLDAIFIVPAIGLMVILFSPRYLRSALLIGAGLLPPIAASGFLNYLKFGSANPLSYGRAGGNTDLVSYGHHIALLCATFGALIILRKMEVNIDRKRAAMAVAIIVGTALFIPVLAGILLQFWDGFVALIIDIRAVADHTGSFAREPEGTVMFFGKVKKALGQSIPWIGILAILLTAKTRDENRQAFVTLVIAILTLTLPFIMLSWHGGGASNMRYFLPALPLLAVLCAKLFTDLWKAVPNPVPLAAVGVWIAFGLGAAWTLFMPSGLAGVHQILSIYFLLATTVAAACAGVAWRFQVVAQRAAVVLLSSSFLLSIVYSIGDFSTSQHVRIIDNRVDRALARLPSRSLVIAYPQWVVGHAMRRDTIVALRDRHTERVDPQLILRALEAGFRVFMPRFEFDRSRDLPQGVVAAATNFDYPEGGEIIELRSE